MTLSEFKAWFEGFTESMDAAPSAKQWKRIKEQVTAINGVAVTERVWVDRYIRPYHGPYWASYTETLSAIGSGNMQSKVQNYAALGQGPFDSHSAMYAVGKADALAQ